MSRHTKLRTTGVVSSLIVGLATWGIAYWKEASQSQQFVFPFSAGMGTFLLQWLVPNPSQSLRYLRAFWEAFKMSPEERLNLKRLQSVRSSQRMDKGKYIYAHMATNDLRGVGTDKNSVPFININVTLISCLLDDVSITSASGVLEIGTSGSYPLSTEFSFVNPPPKLLALQSQAFWHHLDHPESLLQKVASLRESNLEARLKLTIRLSDGSEVVKSQIGDGNVS